MPDNNKDLRKLNARLKKSEFGKLVGFSVTASGSRSSSANDVACGINAMLDAVEKGHYKDVTKAILNGTFP